MKDTIELISKLSPIITLILTTLVITPINNIIKTINNKKTKKIKNTKDIEFLIDKLDNKFKDEFVLNDFKENYFYLQTGIETNERSINSYIKLKDKLSENYTWRKIKLAMPFLKFKNDEIIIKISKLSKIYFKIVTAISFIFFLIGFIILFYFTNDFDYFSYKDFLKLSLLFIMPIACGYYLLKTITPLNLAIKMEKKINKTTANTV